MPLNFVSLPRDVLLKVLSFCDVHEVLCMERVASPLRDAASSRPVWLKQLENLDRLCAPTLLPHSRVQSFSAEQLRTIAISAARTYESLISREFDQPSSTFEKSFQVAMDGICDFNATGLSPRFAPGGRYLFYHCFSKELRVHDLQVDCDVWKLNHSGETLYGYDVTNGSDGYPLLAYCSVRLDSGDSIWTLRVLRLFPSSEASSHQLRSEDLYFSWGKEKTPYTGSHVTISTDYATFLGSDGTMVVRHTPGKLAAVAIDVPGPQYFSNLRDLILCDDHLIALTMLGELAVVSLPQAFMLAEDSAQIPSLEGIAAFSTQLLQLELLDDENIWSHLSCYRQLSNASEGCTRLAISVLGIATIEQKVFGVQLELELSRSKKPVVKASRNLAGFAFKPMEDWHLDFSTNARPTRSCRAFVKAIGVSDRKRKEMFLVFLDGQGNLKRVDLSFYMHAGDLAKKLRVPFAFDDFSNKLAISQPYGIDIHRLQYTGN